MKSYFRRTLLVVTVLGSTLSATESARAHEAPCPYCSLTITQDTPTQDNETVLKIGRKRIEYKCVFCALIEAKTEYQGDLSILAPSEKKGEPIKLSRTDGEWTASSETVAFVAHKASHKVCQATYRAFSSAQEAQKYIDARRDQLPEVKPLSLTQMLAVVDAAK